ncbi:MAG: serine/threonine protein kinase [Sandaracinaceae bacterium]
MSASEPVHLDASNEMNDEDDPKRLTRERIGRYRLMFQLAAGGMATVYLARAEGPSGFDKLVALKRIHPHLAQDRAYVDMFLDEARIASRITHANVCSVFDFGEAEGEYFIAMEYLVGETLARVARAVAGQRDRVRSPAYVAFCARVIADACEGLHAAHELTDARGEPLNVVHRDISPQNVFVSYDGVSRIVDFGIASARDKLHQTSTGEVKGKFAYMAPEQLRDASRVDRRTDVWALGVVLWELLTLRRLFRKGTQPETMYAVLESTVPPPSALRSGIPEELDRVVLKALAREPKARFATTREMGKALNDIIARTGEPFGVAEVSEWMTALFPGREARMRQIMDIARLPDDGVPNLGRPDAESFSSVRTVTATPGAERPRKRRPLVAILAGVLALGAVAGVGLALSGVLDPSEPIDDAPPPEVATQAAPSAGAPSAGTPSAGTPSEGTPSEGTPSEDSPSEDSLGDSEGDLPATGVVTATDDPADDPTDATGDEPSAPAEETTPHARLTRRSTRRGGAATAGSTPADPDRDSPATPARDGPGTVSVTASGGWANVYDEGGSFLGVTPLQVELPAGRHRLQLRPFGQPPPAFVTVQVPAGGRARVRHTIEGEAP